MKGNSQSHPCRYRLWSKVLLSDLDLGLQETTSEDAPPAPVRIQRIPQGCLREVNRVESLDCFHEDGSVWLTISRSGRAYFLDFPGLCSFRIDPRVPLIEYAPETGVGASTIAHLLLDHALPRLISLQEEHFVLHASAWVVRGKAIMAVGQSGMGKSTLAGWLGSQGFPIISDDCLVLHRDPHRNNWIALPSYPSVRLWPDSIDAIGIDRSQLREFAHYSTKRRTAETHHSLRFATAPVPVGGVFILKHSNSAQCLVEACEVNDAFAALSLGVFRLEITSPEMNQREFEILTDVVNRIPFWSIAHGNDYTQLPELQKRMLAVLP